MTKSIITDKDKQLIEELLTRSVDTIYPTTEGLRELLLSGKQLSVYVGIDPTADYVHLGHSTNYLLLERFHKLGHKVIVLVGDFTAMIGDPSDKTSARVQLTREEVEHNLASFKEQIGKILDFDDKNNPIEFKFNSEWLAPLTFEQVVELASNFYCAADD
jgi:tyrosyl-tRNA synthetase